MIAKKVPSKSPGRSDYGYLVRYLTGEQGKHERLGRVSVANCQSENWRVAVTEILNTQLQNTRAVSDKTCHLIISFRPGEEPDDAVLKAVELNVCNELGYQDHQRVCVVHHDTDNLHVHLAINKIHPTRHTIHDPYHDHRTLGQLCERLEREYGFEADNHRALRTGSENRAADMERHTGVQSLLGWLQRECAETMRQAQSWAELHAVLAGNGLQLRERGNGLVIRDAAGFSVKPSSVARELSKTGLERRLGPFQPADELESVIRVAQAHLASPKGEAAVAEELAAVVHAARLRLAQAPPVGRIGSTPPPRGRGVLRSLSQLETVKTGVRRYQVQPMRSRSDTAKLYACYQEERQRAQTARTAERGEVTERRRLLIESAKERARLKRAAARALKGPRAGKRILYGLIDGALKEEIRRINRQCVAERLAIEERYPWRPWADWLRAKAVEGDPEALAALRARDAACGLKGDTLTGKGGRKGRGGPGAPEADCITKKGTVIYHVGSTAVRDDGDRLKVSRGCNQEGLKAALRLALERYGGCIAVNGTVEFKEQVAQAAASGRLPVTFADAVLEGRRRELSGLGTNREKSNGQDQGRGKKAGQSGARSAGKGAGDDRGCDSRDIGQLGYAAGSDPIWTVRGASPGITASCGKPDLDGAGRKPPPQGRHRLRELSELGVVRFAGGTQVLLPRDVPDRLERPGAQPDYGVRRGVSGPGGITAGEAAADRYIAEREAMRLKVTGVLKHRRYDPVFGGAATFAGLRQVEGQPLALMKCGEEIVVLPVDTGTSRRLKRVALGEAVAVTAKGSVARAKGRKL